jgi:hypothetical protein
MADKHVEVLIAEQSDDVVSEFIDSIVVAFYSIQFPAACFHSAPPFNGRRLLSSDQMNGNRPL